MAILTYVLDTNAVTDRINQIKTVEQRLNEAIHDGHRLCLCPPVYYEVIRGLLKTSATRKQQYFEQLFVPALEWVELTTDDWTQAARYWAAATAKGKQLSDVYFAHRGVGDTLKRDHCQRRRRFRCARRSARGLAQNPVNMFQTLTEKNGQRG